MRQWVAVSIVGLLVWGTSMPASAGVADEPGVVLTFNARPHLPSGACAAAAFTGTVPCSSYQTRGELHTGYDVYVVAARSESPLAGVEFGLEYDGTPGSGVDVVGWTLCGDNEFPGNGFPAAGGGTVITYDSLHHCQGGQGPDGVVAVFGALYVYAYGLDLLSYSPRSYVPDAAIRVATCTAGEMSVPADRAGAVRFSAAMVARGVNPCCPEGACDDGPVDETAPVLLRASGTRGSDLVTVEFSEAVGAGAGTPGNYRVSPGPQGAGEFLVQAVAVSGTFVTATLAGVLDAATAYTVAVSGVADLAGNLIAPGSTAPFGTEPAPPALFDLLGATGLNGAAEVTLTFSAPVGAGGDDPASFQVTPGRAGVPAFGIIAAEPSDSVVALSLNAPLAPSTVYTVTVDGVSSAAGDPIAPGSQRSFLTPASETGAPYFLIAFGTVESRTVVYRFTKPMGFGADDPANFSVSPGPGGVGSFSAVSAVPDAISVVVELEAPLEQRSIYVARIATMYDRDGNALIGYNYRQFTPKAPQVDVTPPVLLSAAGSRGSNQVTVTFSEDVQTGAADPASYRVEPGPGGDPFHGVLHAEAAHERTTLSLAAPLAPSQTFTVTVNNVTDVAGNPLAPDSRATFATAAAETEPPTLLEASGEPGSDRVRVVYSEPVVYGAADYRNYVVIPGPGGAPSYSTGGVIQEGGGGVTLILNAGLDAETDYVLHVSNVFDVVGNRILPDSRVGFNTGGWPPADPDPPRLVSAEGTRGSDHVVARFSEPVGGGADDPARFVLTPGPVGAPVFPILTASPEGRVVDLTLDGVLAADTHYTLAVEGVADTAGNLIEPPAEASFETEPVPDVTPPLLVGAEGARGSDRVTVRFSETVGAGATEAGNYRLTPGREGAAAFSFRSVTANGSSVELLLSGLLTGSTTYTITVSGVSDPAGNVIDAGSTTTFVTGVARPWDAVPPVLVSADGERGSDIVTATFSEPVIAGADNVANYRLAPGPSGAATFPLRSVTPEGARVEIRVLGLLADATDYVLRVQGVADTAGNEIAAGAQGGFRTADAPSEDTTPPMLISARAGGDWNQVIVTFSEQVAEGAPVLSNYRVSLGPGMPPAFTIQSAEVYGHHVTLTLGGNLNAGTTYYLTVSGVKDLAGNVILPQSTVGFRPMAQRTEYPVLALHVKPHSGKLVCTTNAPTLLPCASFVPEGLVGSTYDIYVVAVDPHLEGGIAGAAFGIRYPALVRVWEWNRCGDIEFPGQGFPASGGGNSVTWDRVLNCRQTVVDGQLQAVVGQFYVHAYGDADFEITRRNVGNPDLTLGTCAAETVTIPYPSGAGRVNFGPGSGYNPCLYQPPINVERTTWGAIKRAYGTRGREE